jgi:hypothetical protein
MDVDCPDQFKDTSFLETDTRQCLHGAKQKYVLSEDGHATVCHDEGR